MIRKHCFWMTPALNFQPRDHPVPTPHKSQLISSLSCVASHPAAAFAGERFYETQSRASLKSGFCVAAQALNRFVGPNWDQKLWLEYPRTAAYAVPVGRVRARGNAGCVNNENYCESIIVFEKWPKIRLKQCKNAQTNAYKVLLAGSNFQNSRPPQHPGVFVSETPMRLGDAPQRHRP